MAVITLNGVPEEHSNRSSKTLKSSGQSVNQIMDESENNGSNLDLSDFKSECSSDDCDERSSQVHLL